MRDGSTISSNCEGFLSGGRSWIRTSEGVSQQIYSLPPLATWVSYHSPTSLQGRGFKPDPVAPLNRKVLFFKCQPLRRRANPGTATIAWLLSLSPRGTSGERDGERGCNNRGY